MSNLQNLFNQIREKEVKRINEKSEFVSLNQDPGLIHFKPKNTYVLRLLYFIPKDSERQYPFINRYTHDYWDDSAQRLYWVTCPTSEYILDRRGFKDCPVCGDCSNFYKEGERSPSARQLYDRFKRKFNGFVLVYVVNDPTVPENNGTVKIMRYGVLINQFLKREIFGIDIKDRSVISTEEDIIGTSAFDLDKGLNLKITVTSKTVNISGKEVTFNDYSCKFDHKLTKIDITEAEITEQEKELGFESRFYLKSTKNELLSFQSKHILKNDTVDGETEAELPPPAKRNVEQEKIVEQFEKDVKENPKILSDEVKDDGTEAGSENEELSMGSDSDETLDIAALLKKVEEDYN